MAHLVVTVTTPTRKRPATRADDILERRALVDALQRIVSTLTNTGAYSGSITGGPATAEFGYVCDDEEKAA
jgi:hypothetical protein